MPIVRKTIDIQEFDPSSLASDSVVVIIGHRGVGKSNLVRDLLWWHRSTPIGCVMSGTEKYKPFFSKLVPPNLIKHGYDPDMLVNVQNRQKTKLNKKRRDEDTVGYSNVDARCFLVLDDIMASGALRKEQGIRELFLNGRHMELLVLITMQYVMGVPPEYRGNVDYTFLFNEELPANRKRLFENYASAAVPSMDVFNYLMDSIAQKYTCLVIDNRTKSNRIEDRVFYYTANRDHPPFRTCSDAIWAWCKENPQPPDSEEDDEDDEDEASLANLAKKRGNSKKDQIVVNVRKVKRT